jgi:2'-5' RNA ligase
MMIEKQINKIRKIMGLTENKKTVNGYGCVMLDVEFPDKKGIQRKIDIDDIYIDPEDDSFGLERGPGHVTLLYGLHKSVKDNEIKNIINNIDFSDINIELTKIGLFENELYDVLKFDVGKNNILVDANKQLQKLPFTNEYPKFQPHLTIAYLKPGTGKKYVKMFKDLTFKDIKPTKIVYSKVEGNKINFKI